MARASRGAAKVGPRSRGDVQPIGSARSPQTRMNTGSKSRRLQPFDCRVLGGVPNTARVVGEPTMDGRWGFILHPTSASALGRLLRQTEDAPADRVSMEISGNVHLKARYKMIPNRKVSVLHPALRHPLALRRPASKMAGHRPGRRTLSTWHPRTIPIFHTVLAGAPGAAEYKSKESQESLSQPASTHRHTKGALRPLASS